MIASLYFHGHSEACIEDPARQTESLGELMDPRPEADALDDPGDSKSLPHPQTIPSHREGCAIFRKSRARIHTQGGLEARPEGFLPPILTFFEWF